MKDLDIPTGLTVIKNAAHPFTVQQDWFDEAMEKAESFFTEHLKQSLPK